MPGRQFVGTGYKYGFNGKEKDDEIKGEGNSYDFDARIYDSRIGRFLSMDPFTNKFASISAYLFAENTPIMGIDQDGKYIFIVTKPEQFGKPVIKKATVKDFKNVPGFEELYKTESGRKLISKYLNSSKKDLYITVEDIKSTKGGGDTWGQSIDPSYTKDFTNEKGEFDPWIKIEELREKGQLGLNPALHEIAKNFRNFIGIPLRQEATENAFIVIDPQYGKAIPEKVNTAGHELLHIDEYEKGNKGEHHGEKRFEDGLKKIENEYQNIEKRENEGKK